MHDRDRRYPTRDDKVRFKTETGMELKQIEGWFKEMRRHKYRKLGSGPGQHAPRDPFEAQLYALLKDAAARVLLPSSARPLAALAPPLSPSEARVAAASVDAVVWSAHVGMARVGPRRYGRPATSSTSTPSPQTSIAMTDGYEGRGALPSMLSAPSSMLPFDFDQDGVAQDRGDPFATNDGFWSGFVVFAVFCHARQQSLAESIEEWKKSSAERRAECANALAHARDRFYRAYHEAFGGVPWPVPESTPREWRAGAEYEGDADDDGGDLELRGPPALDGVVVDDLVDLDFEAGLDSSSASSASSSDAMDVDGNAPGGDDYVYESDYDDDEAHGGSSRKEHRRTAPAASTSSSDEDVPDLPDVPSSAVRLRPRQVGPPLAAAGRGLVCSGVFRAADF